MSMRKIQYTIKRRWILSFLLMLALPVAIMVASFSMVNTIVNRNVDEYNYEKLLKSKNNIDVLLTQVNTMCQGVVENRSINPLLYEGADAANAYKAVSALKSICAHNENIKNILVVSEKNDVVVSSDGATRIKFYLHSRFEDEEDIEAANKFFHSEFKGTFILGNMGNYVGENVLPLYAKSVHINGIKTNIFFLIDVSKLFALQSEKENFCIVDAENNVVSIKNAKSLEEIKYEKMTSDNGKLEIKDDVIMLYIDSDVADWKYVMTSSSKVFMHGVDKVTGISMIALFLSLLFGVMLAVVLSKHNYMPVRSIVDEMKKIEKQTDSGDEYAYITKVMNSIIEENKRLNTSGYRQERILRERYLEKLLVYNVYDSSIKRKLETCNVIIKTEYFAVVRIVIGGCEPAGFENDTDVQLFAVKNVAEEIMSYEYNAYVTECNGDVFVIVNFEKEENSNVLEPVAGKVVNTLREVLGFEADAIISRMHTTFAGIHVAYNETIDAEEYKTKSDYCEVILCDNIESDSIQDYYVYPIDVENRIIRSILLGEYEKTCEMIDEVYEKNSKPGTHNKAVIKFLTYEVIGTVIKAISEAERNAREKIPERTIVLPELVQSASAEETKCQIYSVIKLLCDFVREKITQKDDISHRIKNIIHSNYMDQNLNISAIADKMNMNASYISRIFKQETGHSLMDYISSIRVEAAIKYMSENKKVNMEKLSEMCGFSNTRTFRRVFTKHTGLSPTKYSNHN